MKGTINISLYYHSGDLRLIRYSDDDGSTHRDERKLTLKFDFILGGLAILCCSKSSLMSCFS